MASHVDIIKTDPLASGEHRLAQAVLSDAGTISIEHTSNALYWRETLASATSIDPDAAPKEFLEALPAKINGTYVYATDPHQDDECPLTHPSVDGLASS